MSFELSEIGFVGAILIGITLFAALKLFRKAMDFILARSAYRSKFNRSFPIVETALWLIYAGWAVGLVFAAQLYSDLAMATVLGMALIWFAWFAAKDWIAGVILKTRNAFEIGQQIKIADTEGKIRHLGYLAMDLVLDDGEIVKIPYSRATGIIQCKDADRLEGSHSRFSFLISQDRSVSAAVARLRQAILSSPWSSVRAEPKISLVETTEDGYRFEAIVHSQGASFTRAIENDVKRYFAQEEVN